MSSSSGGGGGGTNDWEEYFSNSNQTWCWMSKSRKVTYLGASRSQREVFKAGWVVLPASKSQPVTKFYNVFTGKTVNDRSEIPEFVDPSGGGGKAAATATATAESRSEPSSGKKRSLPEDVEDGQDDQKKAMDHYNRLQRNREDRGKGNLAKMRALNNWVKVVLLDDNINKSLSPMAEAASVLELACGKGGDFFKIQKACPPSVRDLDYVGVDIAHKSLEEFVRRVEEPRNRRNDGTTPRTSVRLACVNLGADRLCGGDAATMVPCWDDSSRVWNEPSSSDGGGGGAAAFPLQQKFELVTMQFALHYMCQNKERLAKFFQSWSNNLKAKGYFVATTMDPDVVRRCLRSSPDPTVLIRDECGRICCKMVFDAATRTRAGSNGGQWNWTLGAKYDMTLTEYSGDDSDAEGYNFVEAPEWVVPMTTLIHFAWKYGNLFLAEEESNNFYDFVQYKRKVAKYQEKLYDMRVLERRQGDDLSKIEWTLAKLYKTLVFQKGGNGRQRRVAIVVPYRDEHAEQQRSKHLAQFVPYMLQYMSRTNLPFYIYIVEQSKDGRKFNRGKLLNVGYRIAKERRCSAFVFHDVDLLPDDELLKHYRCDGPQFDTVPDHIARVWSRYSGNKDYIGGVTAFSTRCFERLNGFPNNFWGWGGEDDEVRKRLAAVNQHFSAPKRGSLKDLENMTIKEKVALLRKQNTDREGSDNTWKCMVKNEVLKEHAKTWRENGLFHTAPDGQRKETKLYSRSKEDVHPSGFASKITVELTKNDDRWDSVTSWKDL